MNRQNSSPTRGFTLIELMVAIAVLAIVVTMGIPSYQSFVANQRVKTTAYDLMNSLNYARSEAIKRNANVAVTAINNNWNNGWRVTFTDTGNVTTVLRETEPPAGSGITANNDSNTAITVLLYRSSGRASTAATFTLCDTPGSALVAKRVIEVTMSGRPNLTLDGNCEPSP